MAKQHFSTSRVARSCSTSLVAKPHGLISASAAMIVVHLAATAI